MAENINNNKIINENVRMRKFGETKSPAEAKNKSIAYDDPCHEIRDSPLSVKSDSTNFRGLLNLAFVLLVLSNLRTALKNIINYGILIDPNQWISVLINNPLHRPTFYLGMFLNVFISLSLIIERKISSGGISGSQGFKCIIVNLTILIIAPLIIIALFNCSAIFSSIVCGLYSVALLKLISYHHVNLWCRTKSRYGKPLEQSMNSRNKISPQNSTKNLVEYPQNLKITDIFYFMFAPTLCYQINFPRTTEIRIKFLLKRLIECIVLSQIIFCLIQQWMIPAIMNSLEPLIHMEFSKMAERCLNLAVPNHIIWLLCFYLLFHSFLNLIGELMYFGDRDFYREWWNAESINSFWQTWNMPVHKWCVRHLYKPLVSRGVSKFMASVAVFLVSAFFHEYCISVPLKMFRLWSFFGMMAQIPLLFIVSLFKKNYANSAVWVSLIIGQPLAILMYYHDYYIFHVLK